MQLLVMGVADVEHGFASLAGQAVAVNFALVDPPSWHPAPRRQNITSHSIITCVAPWVGTAVASPALGFKGEAT